MIKTGSVTDDMLVAPLVGARIEINPNAYAYGCSCVAPLVGARIEMTRCRIQLLAGLVAPLVGARIEILFDSCFRVAGMSLPSWERGLKSHDVGSQPASRCRSPRGSED